MGRQISLDFLHKLIGTPYEEKDCWEIVKCFYINAFDTDLSKFDIIPQDRISNEKQIKKKSIFFKKIERPKIGDIILFKVLGHNTHVGIYLTSNTFLHTKEKIGCVIDRFDNWKNRIEGIYRWLN